MKSNSERILLIGDTHPEMIAIAAHEKMNDVDFKIFLPLFFTKPEASLIKKFLKNNSKFASLVDRRTLPNQICRSKLRRPFVIVYLAAFLLEYIGLYKYAKTFMKVYSNLFHARIELIILIRRKVRFVVYDTYFYYKTNLKNATVICPLTHPLFAQRMEANYKTNYSSWPVQSTKANNSIYKNEDQMKTMKIVTLSEFAKKSFIQADYKSANLRVIPIGPKFLNSDEKLISRNFKEKNVLFLGRIEPVKGIETILRLAREKDLTYRFHIMGKSSPEIRDLLMSQRQGNKLEFTFNPSKDDITNGFLNSSLFIMPSFLEGFNIATLEAMSYGLIPIVSKNSAYPEILSSSILESYLFDPFDYEELLGILRSTESLDVSKIFHARSAAFRISRNYTFENFSEAFWSDHNE